MIMNNIFLLHALPTTYIYPTLQIQGAQINTMGAGGQSLIFGWREIKVLGVISQKGWIWDLNLSAQHAKEIWYYAKNLVSGLWFTIEFIYEFHLFSLTVSSIKIFRSPIYLELRLETTRIKFKDTDFVWIHFVKYTLEKISHLATSYDQILRLKPRPTWDLGLFVKSVFYLQPSVYPELVCCKLQNF